MRRILLLSVLILVAASPLLSLACPPPPVPGYSGPDVGPGPVPNDEPSFVEQGPSDDLNPSPPISEGGTGAHTI